MHQKQVPIIKSFVEVFEEARGKKPSGIKWETLRWFSANVLAVTQKGLF
jgi:hypothetical protein